MIDVPVYKIVLSVLWAVACFGSVFFIDDYIRVASWPQAYAYGIALGLTASLPVIIFAVRMCRQHRAIKRRLDRFLSTTRG